MPAMYLGQIHPLFFLLILPAFTFLPNFMCFILKNKQKTKKLTKKKKTQSILCCLSVWMWDHLLSELSSLEKMVSPTPSRHQLPRAPKIEMELYNLFPSPKWDLDWLNFMQVFACSPSSYCEFMCTSLLSWLAQLFFLRHLRTLTLRVFPPPLPQCSLEPWGKGCDMNVLFCVEWVLQSLSL